MPHNPEHRRPPGRSIVTALIFSAVLALAALLLINMRGLRFSWDSNLYLIFSDQMTHGIFERETSYAPLMIWTIGLLKSVLGDMVLSVHLYVFLVWAVFFLAVRQASAGAILPGLFAFALIFANPVSEVQFTYFWTEPAYAALLAIAGLALLTTLAGPNGDGEARERHPVAAALFLLALALLPLQRYIGGYMALYLGGIFLLAAPGWRARLVRLVLLAVAAAPFALVLLRNIQVTGHAGGYRDPATLSFGENFGLMVGVLNGGFRLEMLVYGLAVVLIGVTGFTLLRRRFPDRPVPLAAAALLLLLAPVAQLLFQVYSSSQFDLDPINPRYAVVVVPLVSVLFIWAVAQVAARIDVLAGAGREVLWLLLAGLVAALGVGSDWGSQLANSEDGSTPALTARLVGFDTGQIAVIEGNQRHLFADDILMGKLSAPDGCARYTTSDTYWSDAFRFVPDCASAGGPVFVPFVYEGWPDLAAGYAAAILAPSTLAEDPTARMLDDAPACAAVTNVGEFTLFDLRPCQSPETLPEQ